MLRGTAAMQKGSRSRFGKRADWPGNMYLWIRGLHVAFTVTWSAGLLYLRRLF